MPNCPVTCELEQRASVLRHVAPEASAVDLAPQRRGLLERVPRQKTTPPKARWQSFLFHCAIGQTERVGDDRRVSIPARCQPVEKVAGAGS
jgi:hypothetical protein